MTRECGECSLCCKVFDDLVGVPEKPHGGWCPHCNVKGGGCKIYDDRPAVCRTFECVWLQRDKDGLPDWLKPSKCRVVVNSPDGEGLCLHPDPAMPDAWRRPDILAYFQQLSKSITVAVAIVVKDRFYQILPDGVIEASGRKLPDGSYSIRTMRVGVNLAEVEIAGLERR